MHQIFGMTILILLFGGTSKAQNQLPDWHRQYQVEEAWALPKVAGKYHNAALQITITLRAEDGWLIGSIDSPNSEGFLQFADDRHDPEKLFYAERAERIMRGWLSGNDWEMYDGVGGRWFEDTISTDRYIRYFKRTFRHLESTEDSVRSYRVLGTRLRDEWSKHGYSNQGSTLETIVEVETYAGKIEYIGMAWDRKRKYAASWSNSQRNTRFARDRMIFQPRSPSRYVAYDVISDNTITIGLLDEEKGIDRKNFQESTIHHLSIGGVKFKKME